MEQQSVPIPPIDLAAERECLGAELEDRVLSVLRSGRYVLGPEVEGFEAEFAAAHNCAHGIGVGSGTDALILGLKALGIGPGDRVLTSPFTFFASAGCIAWIGAQPVLADIEPATGLLDLEKCRALMAEQKVDCIMPVHLYGQLVDVRGFRALADEYGASLLEDAAQSHGATRDGLKSGELGDAAAFSFYPTKNMGCAGEGGAILTRKDEVATRVRLLRDHGMTGKYVHGMIGTNSRLQAIQAAILRLKLRHLDGWNAARQRTAAAYDAAFAGAAAITPLRSVAGSQPAYHQYAVRLQGCDRDAVQRDLSAAGIGAAVHYPRPVHLQEAAADWGYAAGSLPEAEALAREVLCLPIHPFLTEEQVQRVSAGLLQAVGS